MTLLMPFAFVYLQLRVSIISINYSVIIWAQAFRSTSLKKRITREQKPLLQSSNSTHLNPSSSNCLPSPSFLHIYIHNQRPAQHLQVLTPTLHLGSICDSRKFIFSTSYSTLHNVLGVFLDGFWSL
ncbi:hypothetical protein HZ326_24236 [Fusarium oxysporum f. sp. albedinis]|nr:hypothetical protein HZ326_24236 [Fusarium oxysporum f. sp. albedinis]